MAAATIVHASSPGNAPAIIAAGSVGILLVIYGQFFTYLRIFPANQRAVVFLFSLVCVLSGLIALLYLATSLSKGPAPTASVSLYQEAPAPPAVSPSEAVRPKPEMDESPRPRGAMRAPSRARLTASVVSYRGQVPEELDALRRPDDADLIETSRKEGKLLTYQTVRAGDDALVITPFLEHLRRQEQGGPILPDWISGYFFPVPLLSVVLNNPTEHPIAVTGIELVIHRRKALHTPWLFVGTVNALDLGKRDRFDLEFNDFGWGEFKDVTLQYDAVPIPDSFRGQWEEVPGYQVDEPFPFRSEGKESPNSFIGAAATFSLAVEAIQKGSGQRTGLLFGNFAYTDVDGASRKLHFLTEVTYRPGSGAGRINPSYKYTVRVAPEGPAETVHVPVAHDVPAGKQDHLLIGLFTERPAAIDFRLRARLSDGSYLEAGEVRLTTFFPKHYGLGGTPKYADRPYLLEERLSAKGTP